MARNLATIVLLLVDLIRNDPQEAQQLYTTTRETLVDPKMSARTMPPMAGVLDRDCTGLEQASRLGTDTRLW